jgi:hypothetical protein
MPEEKGAKDADDLALSLVAKVLDVNALSLFRHIWKDLPTSTQQRVKGPHRTQAVAGLRPDDG